MDVPSCSRLQNDQLTCIWGSSRTSSRFWCGIPFRFCLKKIWIKMFLSVASRHSISLHISCGSHIVTWGTSWSFFTSSADLVFWMFISMRLYSWLVGVTCDACFVFFCFAQFQYTSSFSPWRQRADESFKNTQNWFHKSWLNHEVTCVKLFSIPTSGCLCIVNISLLAVVIEVFPHLFHLYMLSPVHFQCEKQH